MTYQTYRKIVYFTLAMGLILTGAFIAEGDYSIRAFYSPAFITGMGLYGLTKTEKDFKNKK